MDGPSNSPVPSGSASPRIVSEDRRNHAFRSLVSDIAEHLGDSDVQNIIWQQVIPNSSPQNKNALEVLEYLYKHGVYTEYEVRPLAQLLKDIHREDLTSRVDAFWKQFGRHFSNIDNMRSHTTRQFTKGRRSTLSGSTPLTVVTAPHAEIPTIVTTTEVHQVSQESSTAAPTDDIDEAKHFLIGSSPSSQGILSIPSEPSQLEDQQTGQTKQINTAMRPLQRPFSHHLRNESNLLHTGSSNNLHPTVCRRISEPISKEMLSASCSRLEVPSQRFSPQWYNSPPDPPSSNISQVSVHNSEPTTQPPVLHPSKFSPISTSHGQRPPSISSLPAFINDQHHNNSPLNGNRMTVHSQMPVLEHAYVPMRHSMSQEYYHKPHRGRHGHHLVTYGSQSPVGTLRYHGSPSCSPSDYTAVPEAVPQNGHSETDLRHFSITCNCQCPHCGRIRDVPMAHRVPAVVYVSVPHTHNESLDQVQTHPSNHQGQVLTMSLGPPVEIPGSRIKRGSESTSASGESRARSSSSQPTSVLQREQQRVNQNAVESDSESEHWSKHSTESKSATICDEDSHNKPASSMSSRPLESSKKKKKVTKQRPHSATIGADAGDATSTTGAKHNLHSSADTLADNHYTNTLSRTAHASSGALAAGAKPNWKHSLFHTKPKTVLWEPNKLIWPIKRDKLNKYIYKHTSKLKACKVKLELVPDRDYGPPPKFFLQLHPYGSEEDGNKCITAKVTVDLPKKCRLLSKTEIKFRISAREDDPCTGREIGQEQTQQVQVTQSFFYIKKFITHEELKNSHCDYIYVIADVKLKKIIP